MALSTTRAELRIGTSGYQYDHWKAVFYPGSLPKKAWFGYYADHFDTVEINNTFYHLPHADTFEAWQQRAPTGFCYALKFSRYASHMKHLKDADEPIARFLERANHLGTLLGPILVQLPPRWNVDIGRLEDFLRATPATCRWAFEFRNPSWLCADVYGLLRHANAALCLHDLIPEHPPEITADWVYLRFHGVLYRGTYPPHVLAAQARQIRQYLDRGLDIFAYFNNDIGGHAVRNALDLKRYVQAQDSVLR